VVSDRAQDIFIIDHQSGYITKRFLKPVLVSHQIRFLICSA